TRRPPRNTRGPDRRSAYGPREAREAGRRLHRRVQSGRPRRRHVVHGRRCGLRRVQRYGQPRRGGHPRRVRAAGPRRLRQAALPHRGPLRGRRVVQADGKRRPFFEIFTMARESGQIKTGEGPATWAEWSFEKAPDYDILLIPGGFGSRAAVADQPFLERLAQASRRARITTTVCTGSALLARTGLLDGRPATSNKIAWDWVTQQGPRVLWKRKARWVDDGNGRTA